MAGATPTRRIVGRLVAVGALAPVVGGPAAGPAAAEKSLPDFPSKAAMKPDCETDGGEFHETAGGNTWCFFPDTGAMWVCDGDGKECAYYPPFTLPPNTHVPVGGGGVLDGGGADQGGGQPHAPSVAPPDDPQSATATPPADGHAKQGKKHHRGHHGKRR